MGRSKQATAKVGKKTVVLTSRENFVWLSMQEIIPWIERSWLSSAKPLEHEVLCRNVDELSIGELLPDLLDADNVVFTCFTVRLCKIGELLRKSFGVESRYFVYLHNQATILCWPMHAWGMGKYLREDDVFVSSSSADAATFHHSFVRARVEVLPFTIAGVRNSYAVAPSCKTHVPFIYAGRSSVQKNLHTLLYAFRLLREREPGLSWRFDLFGGDDDLGSPNMGMPSKRYSEYLAGLTRRLELEDRVRLMGFRPRGELHRALSSRRHVAVSASLHSDENFGMAQFRSLCAGNLAVLTRWGGYADFATHFPDRVFMASVEETSRGPWVSPEKLATLLARAAHAYQQKPPSRVEVPYYYSEKSIAERTRLLALEDSRPGKTLKMTPLARRVLEKQKRFGKIEPEAGRIFESYADPDARAAFRGYLMQPKPRSRREGTLPGLRCYPWVSIGRETVRVTDPHRGKLELKLSPPDRRDKRGVVLTDWMGTRRHASEETARRLLELGYAR